MLWDVMLWKLNSNFRLLNGNAYTDIALFDVHVQIIRQGRYESLFRWS